MKRLISSLLLAGAFALCACTPNNYSAEGSKSKLSSKGYTVEVYSNEEAKARVRTTKRLHARWNRSSNSRIDVCRNSTSCDEWCAPIDTCGAVWGHVALPHSRMAVLCPCACSVLQYRRCEEVWDERRLPLDLGWTVQNKGRCWKRQSKNMKQFIPMLVVI